MVPCGAFALRRLADGEEPCQVRLDPVRRVYGWHVDELQIAFREAMAHVSAPVTVITTMLDGTPFGTTVSAFASLSISPPMVVFALDNRGAMVERLRSAGRAGVNILGGDQDSVALKFASRGSTDRFESLDWQQDAGLPRIDGAAAWLQCDELTFIPGGDHTVVLGTVAAAHTAGGPSLAYHLRTFRPMAPPEVHA